MQTLINLKNLFEKINAEKGQKQFLTYYFITAHPDCTEEEMRELKSFASRKLKVFPEQVQIYTPLPLIRSALVYWTGIHPENGKRFTWKKTR